MKRSSKSNAFALAVTLIMMALVVVVILAYLANTRTDRSTSSAYANKLRAQMMAETSLAAASKLLYDNTRYGNYVTAMPAPSPSPASIYTELYRPTDPADPKVAKANDYLTFSNAAGELLISLTSPTPATSPVPQIDPRPNSSMVYPTPTVSPLPAFALPSPNPQLSSANSYDFNQIVRVGNSTTGRLVDPNNRPAYGQWVRVRNSAGELIGRYAFFIEDESMKVNVNVTGNDLASPSPTASPNMRINDLGTIPSTTPASQIQEVDPTTPLLAANRRSANGELVGLGTPGQRLQTKSTIGLLNNWTAIEKYAHLLTTVSKDDDTTAKGWQKMDLNKVVADAEVLGTPEAKVDAAKKIANWIRDAWTGPTPLTNLQYIQLFKNDGDPSEPTRSRLRLQLAANIVDYIDQDSIPTDMGDVVPVDDSGVPYPEAIPVIGTEKMPHLVAVHVVYEASAGNFPGSGTGQFTATLKMKLQFRFLNLFETDLDLANHVGSLVVQGVPNITKNGFDVFPTPSPAPSPPKIYTIPLASLTPVNPSPTPMPATATTIPFGVDGNSDSGARSFQTDWLENLPVTFTVSSSDSKPRFVAGKMTVRVLGKSTPPERLDVTAIAINPNPAGTGYAAPSSGNDSVGDFLNDCTSTSRQIASINLTYGQVGTAVLEFGDPRYRSRLVTERWRNIFRTDKPRVDESVDKAEASIRAYAFDWYDQIGNRPFSFIRNKAMVSIGEFGHISAAEYPWRSLYIQHPERPTNTAQDGPKTDIPLRRSAALDWVLLDLFRAGGANVRAGAININNQQQFLPSGGTTPTLPLQSLFLSVPIGAPGASPTPQMFLQSPSTRPVADRVSTGINSVVSTMTVALSGGGTGTTPKSYRIASIANKRAAITAAPTPEPVADYAPLRPYLQPGELAATLSRLICMSEASSSSGSPTRSRVLYTALRVTPTNISETSIPYAKDWQVEQPFREVSNSITTRGNVFRVLYVGQSIKDQKDSGGGFGQVENSSEITSEVLGEAYVERVSVFEPDGSINPDVVRTTGSNYRIISQRVITQ